MPLNNKLNYNKMENQIHQDLKEMRLSGMADSWLRLQETRTQKDVSLQDGLNILIQSERELRKSNRTNRLIKDAKFRYFASVEEVFYDKSKGRDQGKIVQLATCEYVKQGVSVLVTGPAGVGKSYIATALGYQACFAGCKVKYFNMQKLLETMQIARIEGKAARLFDKLADLDLLIIDDFGMKVLDGKQLLDFMELIEDRHGKKSTIISSQLKVEDWYDILANNTTIADAILDRVAKTSYRIELYGQSLRK